MTFEELREKQRLFESNLIGTDGDLSDHNTPEKCLNRGIIGEAIEALESLERDGVLSNDFREEITDIYIFMASLLNHIHMSQEELENRTRIKVTKNFIKYSPLNFTDRTVSEGLSHSRDIFEH
jgi:NTP pyrophosphatase (non-canonical NTP hydrolase)